MRLTLRRLAVVGAVAAATMAATVVPAAAAPPPPTITSLTFSGAGGSGQLSPTITIKGSGFGTLPPTGTAANGCDPDSTDNGLNYGSKLYFSANQKFSAGFGTNCVGITIVSWQAKKVVLKFGNDSYGLFANYDIANGDGYAISVKQTIWGGAVSGLT